MAGLWAWPFWLPAALPLFGVEVETVSRGPGGRVRLDGVMVRAPNATVAVAWVEGPGPALYLRGLAAGEFGPGSAVRVGPVRVAGSGGAGGPEAAGAGKTGPGAGVGDIAREAGRAVERLGRWLPPVRVERIEAAGVLPGRLREGVRVSGVSLEAGAVRGSVAWTGGPEGGVAFSVTSGAGGVWRARAALPGEPTRAAVALRPDAEGAALQTVLWLEGHEALRGVARFVGGELAPASAELRSEGFAVGPRLGQLAAELASPLARLEELRVASVRAGWREGVAEARLALDGTYRVDAETPVPFEARVAVSGDARKVRVEEARLSGGWGRLALSAPVTVDLGQPAVRGDARLDTRVDLARLPVARGYGLSGVLEGTVALADPGGGSIDATFDLKGEGLRHPDFPAADVSLRGRLRNTSLELAGAELRLAGAGENSLRLEGAADLAAREIDLRYEASLAAELLAERLGVDSIRSPVRLGGRARGEWTRPVVEGTLQPVTVATDVLAPVTLGGDFTLRDNAELRYDAKVKATAEADGANEAEDAALEIAGVAGRAPDAVRVRLERLLWRDPSRGTLRLEAPFTARLGMKGGAGLPERLRVEPFVLKDGGGRLVAGGWTEAEGLRLRLETMSTVWLHPWLRARPPRYDVAKAGLRVDGFRPRLSGAFDFRLGRIHGMDTDFAVRANGDFGPDAVRLEQFEARFREAVVAEGSARLPVALALPPEGGAPALKRSGGGELAGKLSVRGDAEFAEWLREAAGVEVRGLRIDGTLGGTPAAPEGEFRVRCERFAAGPDWPAAEAVSAGIALDPDQVRLDPFEATVNGGRISGDLALRTAALADWLEQPRRAWRGLAEGGSGTLRIADWKAANWSDRLPSLLRQSGAVSGELRWAGGTELDGTVDFRDFALRPTESMPAIDGIGGRVRIDGLSLALEEASAEIGGGALTLDGAVDFTDPAEPVWQVSARGERVPLVRTGSLLLRSDLDLRAEQKADGAPPLVEGVLNLRSSVLLLDFDPLSGSVAKGPSNPPPFFSIDAPAVADWRFDVKVGGEQFMRVRNPYFRATLSADFALDGTFAKPRLLGGARIESGQFVFPGATMKLDDGEAYIEAERPDEVRLAVTGIARRASHVVTMEVTETLADPVVRFESSPPLGNAAILRLLATGSPTGGAGGGLGLYLGKGLLGPGGMDDGPLDRLTVDVGEETARSGRGTVNARYELTDDLYLNGEYDKYDAYNLDLIWKLYSK